ncbi:Chs5p SKDI_12G3610 [Saccharomyces kudriavzevii IFO 1802]|uniref:Uncharacterized protein n=2 Tax=Saccharomyces kudriavzevii (strain ATCC MYA-4449 / AS 2.2408 / CBS 8840 / NBRC 1802 / NCYC 2889) TaxID=226230 RepID=A0AA35J2V9_SACK1|nr:uncharacterized protein SKDI_12G3610 [Saccharomyces kudriavzevii IFO 1802]EJT44250.1 CHS5-like protein [Saccharomyces kudriavzevii IFO 1802]CAI4046838.1 hypothetical protein SKDI_12G3610 [Saccharomyces kudriavzevii IFO 1802]
MSSVDVLLTVGKLDASLALLTTQDHHVIEFPTVLLPENVKAGSIIKMQVSQNLEEERKQRKHFKSIQAKILEKYGTHKPESPVLKSVNVTQTSCVLAWEPLKLGSAKLKSLILYRKGIRSMVIPNPFKVTTTKISGLSVDTPYEFQLKLTTTSGTLWSEKIILRTRKMTDMSGITVCLGPLDSLKEISDAQISQCLSHIGARPLQRRVAIDTTHFVCNDLDNEESNEELMKAKHNNIPIVRPEWVRACEVEKRIVGVRGFYLDADQSILKDYTFPPVNEKELANSNDDETVPVTAVENKEPETTEDAKQIETHNDGDRLTHTKEEIEEKEGEATQESPVEDTLHVSATLENENTAETVNPSVRSLKSEPVGTPNIDENKVVPSVEGVEEKPNESEALLAPNEDAPEQIPENLENKNTDVNGQTTNVLMETEEEQENIRSDENNVEAKVIEENDETLEGAVAKPETPDVELETPEVNDLLEGADEPSRESVSENQQEDIECETVPQTAIKSTTVEPTNESEPTELGIQEDVSDHSEGASSEVNIPNKEAQISADLEGSQDAEEQEITEPDAAVDDVLPTKEPKKNNGNTNNNNKKKNKKSKKKGKKK